MSWSYKSKKEYNLKLTEAQTLWLNHLLGLSFDGCFEGNPRERKLCDNIHDRLAKCLEIKLTLKPKVNKTNK